MLVYHISDIHIHKQERFNEYRNVFKNLVSKIEKDNLIVITGDVFHDKCYITPESLILFKEFMIDLSNLCEIIIIDGNHDVNINNNKRKSNIEASLKCLKTNKTIHYLKEDKKSVKIKDINFILTMMNSSVEKFKKNKNEKYVSLYHGTLYKCKMNENYEIDDDKYLKIKDFKDYDITMLGDIHKHQFLDKNKTIGYASSLIQQNFGEDLYDHGMIIWDMDKLKGEFVRIENEVCYVKCYLTKDSFKIPELNGKNKLNIELNYESDMISSCESQIKNLKEKYTILNYRYNEIKSKETKKDNKILKKNIVDVYKDFSKINNLQEDKDIIEILNNYISENNINNKDIKLKKVKFSNLFSYGEKNIVNFKNYNGMVSIIGENGSGKSSLIDVILFILFDKFSKGKSKDALNIRTNNGEGILELEVNGAEYKIVRKLDNKIKSSKIYIEKNGENISEDNKTKTDNLIKEIVGSYEEFITTNILLQNELEISSMNDVDKLKLLLELLNINKYEEIKKTMEKKKNSLKRSINALVKETDKYSLIIKKKKNINDDIIKNEKELEELDNKLKDIIKRKCKYECDIEYLNIDDYDMEEIEKEIKKLKKKIKNIKNNETSIDELEDVVEELKKEVYELNLKKSGVKNIKIDKEKIEISLQNTKNLIEKTKNSIFDSNINIINDEDIIKKYDELKIKTEQSIKKNKKNIDKLIQIEKDLNKELLLSKNKGIIEPYQHKIDKLCFNDKCNNCKNNRDEINEIEIYNLNNIRDENEIFEDINILMLEEKKNKLYDLEKKLKYIEKDCNDEINENKIKIKQNENSKNEFENNKNSKLINLQKEVDEYLLLLENNKLLEIDNNIDIKIEKKQEKINKKQKELKSLKEVIQNEKEIEERLKELKKVKKNFEKYEEIKIELNQIINIEKYNEKELKIKKDIDNILNKKYGEILGVEEIYNEKIKELDDYKEQYNKVIKVVDLYEKNNFIGFIMDNYVKRLEILINNILMSIVDYKVKIEQDIDELRIYKIENEAMINIRQLSGNEKFLINIAVKSALNNMSVSFKTNFFIIDEGFGSCDEIRLKKINNLLDLLNNEFELCLVISHLDIIKSKKNKEINIRRNCEGFSYIE